MLRPSLSSKLNLQLMPHSIGCGACVSSDMHTLSRCPAGLPLGPELIDILAPDLGVVVRSHDENGHLQALGQHVAFDCHV